jgi:hypothetical protein
VVTTPQGEGIALVTVWDSPVDAGEFYDIAGQAIERRFNTKGVTAADKLSRRYAAGSRTLQLSTSEIGGRPAVIYVDVPAGANTAIVQPAQMRLTQ